LSGNPALTVVTTMYQSSPYLEDFHRRVSAQARALVGESYEVLYVNDGSPDDSLAVALRLHRADRHVRVLDLARNFGHHRAIMSGLAAARGTLVFLIDCDLEEQPEDLARFHAELVGGGADAVFGVQAQRKGGAFERLSGQAFYRLFNLLSPQPVVANQVIARLMSRRYVQALVAHRDREIFLAGLCALAGFKQVAVPVKKLSRDRTTYTLGRRVAAFVNAVTSFSAKPLVYVFYMGCFIVAVSLIAALTLVIRRLFFGVLFPGWASLIVTVCFFGGLTVFCLGLIGIYLAKVFSEVKERPYAIVRDVYEHGRESADSKTDQERSAA
jgi:putative glycosyltransferase